MKCALLIFKYFDEAFSISAMLERPAWSLAYIFFFFVIDCKGEEKLRGDKWMRISQNASERLRDSGCRIQNHGNRWQTMKKSKK